MCLPTVLKSLEAIAQMFIEITASLFLIELQLAILREH